MDLNTLPDQPRPGSDKTLATIANVAAVMDEAGICARYNVIKKKVEIELPGHQGTPDNLDNVTLTGIVSLCAQHSMPTGHIGEYVNAIADRQSYNPVTDWIDSAPWDGRDRLPELFATVIQRADYPDPLKRTLLRKWLLSAVAAVIMPSFHGRGVLTLQGPQGIGKTSWVRSLVSVSKLREQVIKVDHHMDGNNKDSVIGAITHWIVEIGELDSSFKKDIARLKGFLTSDSDRVRRPYDRRESEYRRRTVFIATVNEANFLIDSTGNSRWWTIAVDELNFRHGIDMQQLFAQLAVEVRGGAQWWLDDSEEAALEEWNSRHRAVSVIAELVQEAIDPAARNSAYLTATQVVQVAGIEKPSNAQAKEAGAFLRELYGEPKRVRGRDCWKVSMREPTGKELTSGPCGIKLELEEQGVNGAAPGEIF
jgi:putative DNA primase/helicase